MKRKQLLEKYIYIILVFLMFAVMLIVGLGIRPTFAHADVSKVLNDLKRDPNFKESAYPSKSNDYSVEVIQIAESESGNLYLYTYQPSQATLSFTATKINMSLSQTTDGTKLYTLTFLNSSGVFCKYLVNDLKVKQGAIRYYNITSIYRKWESSVDRVGNENDNKKIEKCFSVAKLFTAESNASGIKYSCIVVDVVEIINPFVDFLSYGESSGWDLIFDVTNWTDIHYIAFSTDKKIDTLKKGDVTYTTQPYHYTGLDKKGYTYGEKSELQYITLTGDGKIGIDGHKEYTWKNIYKTSEFIKTTNLTGSAKTAVEKSEFVLVFLKTSFKEQSKYSFMQGHYKEADGTKVSDVAILRLEFETNGVCYNLGALMDIQESDETSGNKPSDSIKGNTGFNFFLYVIDCLKKFFAGKGNIIENAVAVLAIVAGVAVLVFAVKFIRWTLHGLFGGGE